MLYGQKIEAGPLDISTHCARPRVLVLKLGRSLFHASFSVGIAFPLHLLGQWQGLIRLTPCRDDKRLN